MQTRSLLSGLFLATAIACSGTAPMPIESDFAATCTTLPTLTAPAPDTVLTDDSLQSRFTLRNRCAGSASGPWDFLVTRTGAVTSAGPASPSSATLAGGASVNIMVRFKTGSTAGSGTITLRAVNDVAPQPPSVSATQAVTVKRPPPGIPFGVFGIRPDSNFTDARWTGGVRVNRSMPEVLKQLRAARNKSPKLRMWFDIMGGDERQFFTSPPSDLSFNLDDWKNTLDSTVRGVGFKPDGSSPWHDTLVAANLIKDSTLQGFVLLDDPENFHPDPTFDQIEQMARHMKLRFPTALTAVRVEAVILSKWAGPARTYQQLDVGWGQFKANKGDPVGDPEAYRNAEIAAADRLNLGLVLGINMTKGQGPFTGNPDSANPISPADLLSWGRALLQNSDYACGFMLWDIKFPHLSDSSMKILSDSAKQHVASPCRRR